MKAMDLACAHTQSKNILLHTVEPNYEYITTSLRVASEPRHMVVLPDPWLKPWNHNILAIPSLVIIDRQEPGMRKSYLVYQY